MQVLCQRQLLHRQNELLDHAPSSKNPINQTVLNKVLRLKGKPYDTLRRLYKAAHNAAVLDTYSDYHSTTYLEIGFTCTKIHSLPKLQRGLPGIEESS